MNIKIMYTDAVVFVQTYNEILCEKVVNTESALRILDLLEIMGKYYSEYNSKVEGIKIKYAAKDENGQPIQNEYGYIFEEETQTQVVKELLVLGREEFVIQFTPLEKKDLDGMGLTINQIALLKQFIKK